MDPRRGNRSRMPRDPMMPKPATTDVQSNRTRREYSAREYFLRVVWGLCLPLFRWSPRIAFAWRNWLLRRFGANVGDRVHIYNTAQIRYPWHLSVGDDSAIGEYAIVYNLGFVQIGKRVTVSQYAHLCAGTHDYRRADMPLVRAPISVEDDVWICAEAFIGPGVTVSAGAIVGACACVFSDVDAWTIVGGNPARFLKNREQPIPYAG